MKTGIGAAIKKDREALGLNQTEFSELLGVSKNSISYWERGVCNPYIENIIQLIQFLGHDSYIAECVREIFKKPIAVQHEKQPVVRWLWAKQVCGDWQISPVYRSKEEALKTFNGQFICLEHTRQEFPE